MRHEADQSEPPADTAGGSGSLWGRMDRFVATAADNAYGIGVALLIICLLLALAAFFIDVLAVTFDGNLKGGTIIDPPEGFDSIEPKQVGFLAAPNWFLTGFLFLPYAVMQALKVRSAIEPVIDALVENRMLVTQSFEVPNREAILLAWRKRSQHWMPVVSFVALIVFGLVVFDFIDVVAQWTLASETKLAELAKDVTLHHGDYEFDWSVAAVFEATTINRWVNVIFAGLAYLFIAAFGACFLFAAFFYFFTVGGFFSKSNLTKLDLVLLPNPRSTDARCGFEVFEEFFDPFIQTAIVTAVIALSMYLQNIYLRAPTQPDIFVMVLGPIQAIVEKLLESPGDFNLGDFTNLGLLTNIKELSGFKFNEIPLQVFGSAVALLLIVLIVFGYVWWFLRESALSGKDVLTKHGNSPVAGVLYTEDERARIDEIQVWPIGWISLNLLISCIAVVILSLWWPRLIALILALFIYRALSRLINTIIR